MFDGTMFRLSLSRYHQEFVGFDCSFWSITVLRRILIFAGSKDEAFFDSQPWMESDCEDDFLSVNGGKIRSKTLAREISNIIFFTFFGLVTAF